MIGKPMDGHEDEVRCVTFSVNGKRVLSEAGIMGMDWSVRVWNVDSNRQTAEHFVNRRKEKYELSIKELLQHISLRNSKC